MQVVLKKLQNIVGKSLYYAIATYATMLIFLNSLVEFHRKHIIEKVKQTTHLFYYCASHPDTVTYYRERDIILHIY